MLISCGKRVYNLCEVGSKTCAKNYGKLSQKSTTGQILCETRNFHTFCTQTLYSIFHYTFCGFISVKTDFSTFSTEPTITTTNLI
jgi:hypothetical protein